MSHAPPTTVRTNMTASQMKALDRAIEFADGQKRLAEMIGWGRCYSSITLPATTDHATGNR